MKLLLLFASSVLIGCGTIFGLVHGIVPHLVEPNLFPQVQAREPQRVPVGQAIQGASSAVGAGIMHERHALIADGR